VSLLSVLAAAIAAAGPIQHQVSVAVYIAGRAPVRALQILHDEIGSQTPLELEPADVRASACEPVEGLSCWARAARERAPFALVVRIQPDSSVIAILLPTAIEDEEALFSASIVLDDRIIPADVEPWRALARRLGDRLSRRKAQLHPGTGTLLIRAPAPGFDVRLDDERVGAISLGGQLELPWVLAGPHVLGLIDPRGERIHNPLPIEVRTATTTTIDAVLRASETAVSTYGGLGLAAVGAAFVVYGLAAPRNQDLCFTPCSGTRFVTFGEGGGETSALMIVPLGYSLALAGLGWAGAPLVLDEGSPWLALVIGLAVGAVSYAVSAAAGG